MNATAEQQWPGCQNIPWEMPKERPVEEGIAGNALGRVCPWGHSQGGLCQWCLPGAWGSACAQGLLAAVELLSHDNEMLCCRMLYRSQYHKPQAVGFVGAVAVSVSQERINTPDSAAEQLQWTGTPLSSGQAMVLEQGTAWFSPPAFLSCASGSAGSLLAYLSPHICTSPTWHLPVSESRSNQFPWARKNCDTSNISRWFWSLCSCVCMICSFCAALIAFSGVQAWALQSGKPWPCENPFCWVYHNRAMLQYLLGGNFSLWWIILEKKTEINTMNSLPDEGEIFLWM